MARVSCRCGKTLDYDPYGPERILCPHCGSKVRVRRRIPGASPPPAPEPEAEEFEIEDGYIRFPCPCGRRLKIKAKGRPEAGKCPDCGRVVPVPDSSAPQPAKGPGAGGNGPDGERTGEMSAEDVARINTWSQHWASKKGDGTPAAGDRPDEGPPPAPGVPIVRPDAVSAPSAVKMEAGLRVCPRCGKPVHLGAANCRECGAIVPKR